MTTAVSAEHRITLISNRNFEAEVVCAKKPVLLMCMSGGAAYTEQVSLLKKVSEVYGESVSVCRLEEEFINGFRQMYGIKGTPIFLLFHAGKEKGRMLGTVDKERLEAFLNQNLPLMSAGLKKAI